MIRLEEFSRFFFSAAVYITVFGRNRQRKFQSANKFLAFGNIKAVVKFSWSLKNIRL